MDAKIDLAPWADVFGVLASIAEVIPALRMPIEGSIKALKQILQYTEVSNFD
jgi:hypothetical protein